MSPLPGLRFFLPVAFPRLSPWAKLRRPYRGFAFHLICWAGSGTGNAIPREPSGARPIQDSSAAQRWISRSRG